MILPNKNIKLSQSLLGTGAIVLEEIKSGQTVSSLWEKVKSYNQIQAFEKFVLTLDLLYALNLIVINEGLLKMND